MGLSVLTGPAAVATFEAPDFAEAWARLEAVCPWAEVSQSHPFIRSAWALGERAPVLISEEVVGPDGATRLAGALALSAPADGGPWVGVGGRAGPGHGWLSEPLRGSWFAERAARAILERGGPPRIALRSVLPAAGLDWTQPRRPLGRRVRLEAQRRFLATLDRARAARALEEKASSAQLARLKRLGALRVELASSASEREAWLRRGAAWSDARRVATGKSAEHAPGSLELELLARLARDTELLEVSSLSVGDAQVSILVLWRWRGQLTVELLAEDLELESAAPSLVHWLLTEQRLTAEGARVVDVTRAPEWARLMARAAASWDLELLLRRSEAVRHAAGRTLVNLSRWAIERVEG